MRTAAVFFGLIATIMAMPAPALQDRQGVFLCSGLTSTPLCCDVDILGVANLNCAPPPQQPTTVAEFNDICASIGQIDRCCALPILDQALICGEPV